jgi:hypothetical protein
MNIITNRTSCRIFVAALALVGIFIGSAQAQMQGQVQVQIDPLKIGYAIAGAVNANQNRESFVQNLLNTTYYKTGQKYNVLVCNLAQHPQVGGLHNVVFYASGTSQGALFGVWAFTNGEFTHDGDGGYINWAMAGRFKRDGDQGRHVTFF